MVKVKDKDVDEETGPKKGGLMVGLVNLLEKLNQVAEQGGEVVRTFEIERGKARGGDKPVKGVVGFSIRTMGEGDESVKVEPFGNIRHNEATGESVVDEVREPLVDVFDEDQRVLIVAEMPGVEPNDVRVDLEEGTLTLSGERGELRYRKELAVLNASPDKVGEVKGPDATGDEGVLHRWKPKLPDLKGSYAAMLAAASELPRTMVKLSALFVLQTIVLPLFFLWLVVRTGQVALRPSRRTDPIVRVA
ncbi:MAG: hypothetical protein EOO27_23860 [Comamonadaceae bacterium]|nr:MAG: hypothetical protein EOO27_23860 [Comamonadaceae bacterium]